MNGMNVSNNIFNSQSTAKIAGGELKSYSNDGGRRSVEEVRQDQINADHMLDPNAGKEFQVNMNKPFQKPLQPSGMTGAFINNGMNKDVQLNNARTQVQSLQNLGRRGF